MSRGYWEYELEQVFFLSFNYFTFAAALSWMKHTKHAGWFNLRIDKLVVTPPQVVVLENKSTATGVAEL